MLCQREGERRFIEIMEGSPLQMPRGLSVKKSYPHIELQSAVFWHTMSSARATLVNARRKVHGR